MARSVFIDSIHEIMLESLLSELESLLSEIKGRTALHLAAESGILEIVENLGRLRPKWTTKADWKGITPLHLAAANGHLEVVRHLTPDQNQNQNHHQGGSGTFRFLIKDNEGNTPLHMAAVKGHYQIVKLFVSKLVPGNNLFIKPTSSLQRCVIRCGVETLQQIVEADPNFLNGFDEEGNTLLHTATLLHNLPMVRYLVGRGDVCIDRNKHGFTALDIINSSGKGSDDVTKEIRTLLKGEGKHMTENFFQNMQCAILSVFLLIVFMTYEAGLNPPGGVFQEDKRDHNGDLISPKGTSIMAFTNPHRYVMFSIVNTLAFVSSMSTILLLTSGVRMKETNFMWLMGVGIWFTITSMGYFYFDTVQFITLTRALRFNENPLVLMRRISMSIWLGLTTIILLVPTNYYTRFSKKIGVLYANGMLRSNAPFISAISP